MKTLKTMMKIQRALGPTTDAACSGGQRYVELKGLLKDQSAGSGLPTKVNYFLQWIPCDPWRN